MKVIFFSFGILEHGGGLEKYFIETTVQLRERYSDLNIRIVTMNNNYSSNLQKILSLYYGHDKKSDPFRENNKDIIKSLKSVSYIKCNSFTELKTLFQWSDRIYTKGEILELLILKLIIGYKNIPKTILGCHTALYFPNAISLKSKIHNYLYSSFIFKFLISGINTFHVLNSLDQKILKKLGINEKRIKLVYNPFDVKKYQDQVKKSLKKVKLNKNKFNILWVGHLKTEKGIEELSSLIKVINRSADLSKKIEWHICGDGELRSKILNLEKNNVNVNWYGHIENSKMASIYQQSDLFINTSKVESFGYTIVEAMSVDVPVIVFDRISIAKDIIVSGTNGFIVNSQKDFIQKIKISYLQRNNFSSSSNMVEKLFNPNRIYNLLKDMIYE